MGFMVPTAQKLSESEAREYTGDPEAEAGWYAQLTAPGYLDQTDWMGPFDSEKRAYFELLSFHEVDENGDALGEECPTCKGVPEHVAREAAEALAAVLESAVLDDCQCAPGEMGDQRCVRCLVELCQCSLALRGFGGIS